MPAQLEYFDGCPSAHALDLIGDRWALLIVRELLLGPKRFTDLRRGLPRISRNVLSQRLDDLESAGVLARDTLPPPAASAVYGLTDWGLELEFVLTAMGRWAVRSPTLPLSDTLGVDTFVLGLRALFDPEAAGGLAARYELRVEPEVFGFSIARGRLEVHRGAPDRPAPAIAVDPAAMAAVARGDRPLLSALSTPEAGAEAAPARFAALFRAPVVPPAAGLTA